MKVSEAIEMLTRLYSPEEELVILWWDKARLTETGIVGVCDESVAYADERLGDSDWVQSSLHIEISDAIAEFHEEED